MQRSEKITRLRRWLYQGLHSLDFPFLYYKRPLWDIVVIVLSIGGVGAERDDLGPRVAAAETSRRAPARTGVTAAIA